MAVYVIRAEGTDLAKIGFAADPEKRLRALQGASAHRLYIARIIEGGRRVEKALHRHFANRRLEGEWFRFCDEMLSIAAPIIAEREKGALDEAIAMLGGQVAAAKLLGKSQPAISDWLNLYKPPLEICIQIERLTEGRFVCEQLRPDLADLIGWFRQAPAPRQRLAA